MKNGNIIKIFSWHYTLFEPLAACGGCGDGNITELTDLLLIAFRLTLNLMFILMCWWLHSMAYGAGVMGGRMGWMASRKFNFCHKFESNRLWFLEDGRRVFWMRSCALSFAGYAIIDKSSKSDNSINTHKTINKDLINVNDRLIFPAKSNHQLSLHSAIITCQLWFIQLTNN